MPPKIFMLEIKPYNHDIYWIKHIPYCHTIRLYQQMGVGILQYVHCIEAG